MNRRFRFVGKKRGQRRTGSNLAGSLGEAIFFGALFLIGTIVLSSIVANQLIKPDSAPYVFGVGGWLVILVLASLTLTAGGGLIWTVLRVGTSAERRSVMARQAANIEIVQPGERRPRYPAVPPYDGLNNSPGVELAYRLPPAQTPGWRLLATTLFTLLWNFVGCLLTVSAISNHLAGHHEWLTAFIIPYWVVSTWSIRHLLQLIVLHTGMGQTTVEISELPLIPGQQYQVAIAQHGQVTMKSFRLFLVCEEEATFTQGTDIRTEIREAYRQPCFEKCDFRIEPGTAFHDSCTVEVPPAAMHSFHSPHNGIRWRLVVHGEAEGWPAFERGFPVVVHPGDATMRVESAELTGDSGLIAAGEAALAAGAGA